MAEYRALSRWGRLRYWLYRHPVVMFGVGPAWLFLFQHRLPVGMMRSGVTPWVSTMATNLGIAALAAGLIWLIGLVPFLLVHLPISSGGRGRRLAVLRPAPVRGDALVEGEDWKFQEAALHGSSHYDLPAVLSWLTGNIGIHHVHHLSSRVPFYRLPEVLQGPSRTAQHRPHHFLESLRCVKLVLWDESRRLVSFREARLLA